MKGEDGKLKPYEEIVAQHKTEALETWMNDQRDGAVPFHKKEDDAAALLTNREADPYVEEVDGE